jgi:RNA polymerase sigma-70 factor, ECF subfamily
MATMSKATQIFDPSLFCCTGAVMDTAPAAHADTAAPEPRLPAKQTRQTVGPELTPAGDFGCVAAAWRAHEAEVLRFLVHRVGDRAAAQDLVQDVFMKAMRSGQRFCALDNARAWLFQVARTTLIDRHRTEHQHEPLPDHDEALAAPEPELPAPVDALAHCIAGVLPLLSAADADILRACDLQGRTQAAYAGDHALTLPAAKARLQRARQRLRRQLVDHCQVRFDAQGRVVAHCSHGR